jgi:hypothetical protein
MTDGVTNTNLPNAAQGHGHGWGRAENALQTVLDFLLPGSNFEQAVRDALNAGALDPADIDLDTWSSLIEQMPHGHQRQLADSADMLPATLRDAMEALGLARESARGGDAPDVAGARAGDLLPGQSAPAQASPRGELPAALARHEATAPTTYAAPTGASQANAATAPPSTTTLSAQPAATSNDALLAPGTRVADATGAARTDAAIPAAGADRLQPNTLSQPILQQQVVPAPQGRTDALPAQGLSLAAGATVLANPQGNVMAPNAAAPPRGTGEALPAQPRDGQLAPAGHTAATGQRRDARKGAQAPAQQRPDPLLALLSGHKRPDDGDDGATSFQWVFWILTVIAYGALAIAVVAMVPSGGGLTDGLGRPTTGAYALVVGAAAALASWLVARRLTRR